MHLILKCPNTIQCSGWVLCVQGIGHSLSAYGSHILRPESANGELVAQTRRPNLSPPNSPSSQYGITIWETKNEKPAKSGDGNLAAVMKVN